MIVDTLLISLRSAVAEYKYDERLRALLLRTIGVLGEVRNTPQEERFAWDCFAAAALSNPKMFENSAAQAADALLVDRRKRFGGGK